MLNKYLEQLKERKLQIEVLEKEVFFVLNENSGLGKDRISFLHEMLATIKELNESIKKQDKGASKEKLNTLIKMLNSIDLEFFNILKGKEEIDKQLTDKYSLSPEDTLKVFEDNEKEMNNLKAELKKIGSDFNFSF